MMHLVEGIMSKPAITIDAQARVRGALELMRQNNIASPAVNSRPPDITYGILTKRDIITKVVARDLDPRYWHISEIMTQPVINISPHASSRDCPTLMGKANVHCLPVFDGDNLVGLISDMDIFNALKGAAGDPQSKQPS